MPSVFDRPYFTDEAAAYAKLESIVWPRGPYCPHCGEVERVGRMQGKATRVGLLKCYSCRKQFRVTVGTVFESSHVPLHVWLQATFLMVSSKKGVSSNQLHRTLGLTLKSAWFLSHRLREALKPANPTPLGGGGIAVEADETFIGPKQKNRAYKPAGEKMSVMALVERGGSVRSFHVANVTANTLRPIIGKHVYPDTRFQTDESGVYAGIGWNFTSHGTVNHSAKEFVRGDDYTNTVEGFFSILKRGIYGIYQHVREAHLPRYLAEYDFRYSFRAARGYDDTARMDKALAGIVGRQLTYQRTRGTGTSEATH